jgi:hypothetical protein
MTDILLTHGYFLSEDEKERQIMKPYPPLGLLYLSAYLKTREHSVEVYDSTFGTRLELLQKIRRSPGAIIGIADRSFSSSAPRNNPPRPSFWAAPKAQITAPSI